jgi:Phosphate-selective porin O and P
MGRLGLRGLIGLGCVIATAGAPRVASADPEPLRPVVTRRGWQLDLTGYVQADAIAWSQASVDELDPSTGQPLNEERFLIRRGRLRAEAHRDAVSAAIELDGNTQSGAVARIVSAQIGWTYALEDQPFVAVTAGLFKIPFGVEVPASERDKAFLEPPAMSRALFPGNYDAGAMVAGRYGLARWSLAIMNGAPVGDAQWRGRDPASSYDVVGRLGADVAGPRRLRIAAGVSALSGTGLHPGTPPTKDGIQWVDDNQNGRVDPTEIQIVPGSPGEPSQPFTHNALGADLQVHWCLCALGNGTAFLEAALATNLDRGLVYADPVAASRDLRQLGFAIGAMQELGAYVQIGARYDRYDADRDAMDREGAALINVHKVFSTVAVMATARWNDARVIVEYDHERNPFGRGDDGAPITRAADRVTLRAQVGF